MNRVTGKYFVYYGLKTSMALVSVRLFCKNLGDLQEFVGQMVYRPLAKNCPYAYAFHDYSKFRT